MSSVVSAGHVALDDFSLYRLPPLDGAAAPAPAIVKTIVPTIVKAAPAPVPAPVYVKAEHSESVDYDAPAKYDFAYGVSDPHTGDVKEQSESRDGHTVHGSYSLIDADGFKRTVEYTADEHNGFNAVVHREPLGHAAPVAKVIPAVAKVVAPHAAYHR